VRALAIGHDLYATTHLGDAFVPVGEPVRAANGSVAGSLLDGGAALAASSATARKPPAPMPPDPALPCSENTHQPRRGTFEPARPSAFPTWPQRPHPPTSTTPPPKTPPSRTHPSNSENDFACEVILNAKKTSLQHFETIRILCLPFRRLGMTSHAKSF
jgi:hypothetical protein